MAQAVLDMAMADLAAGRAASAGDQLRRLLQRSPNDPAVLVALARAHAALGERDAAGVFAARAASGRSVSAAHQAGEVLAGLGRHAEAARAFESCLRQSPGEPACADGLARARLAMGDAPGTWAAYEASAAARPDAVEPCYLWQRLLLQLGRPADAAEVLRRGLRRLPDHPDLLEFLCYVLNFGDADPAEHLALHQRLGAIVARRAGGERRAATRARGAGEPLRVAFLSGDLCFHACAFFLSGLISALDRARLTPVLYANNEPDDTTRGFASLAPLRLVGGLDDAALAAAAREDGIDVLVECNGWSGRHRMPAVAGRLAPLQVTYLGYPNTTGVAALDARLVDATTDPPGAERFASERLERLPGCFVCYAPAAQTPPPAMSPGLAQGEGGVTIASFNRLAKLSDATLRAWGRVLARVLERDPHARLLVKTEVLPGADAHLRERFATCGGDASRLAFAPFEPDPARHLAAYHGVDLALDPFPYNGTTTTCEALVMGVPVVTLAGQAHRGRVGASLMAASGAPELAAPDEDSYVELAASLACDATRLRAYHERLPGFVRASRLCDAAAHARAFESAIEGLWRDAGATR